jgi:hypothetical protein
MPGPQKNIKNKMYIISILYIFKGSETLKKKFYINSKVFIDIKKKMV